MQTGQEASPEEIAKVLEVLRRSAPRGAMIEQIVEQTGCPNYIVHSAIHILRRQGVNVVGRNLIEYDPNWADANTDDPGPVTS